MSTVRLASGLYESADGGWQFRRVTYDYGIRWHLLRAVVTGDPGDPDVDWEWQQTFQTKTDAVEAVARIEKAQAHR